MSALRTIALVLTGLLFAAATSAADAFAVSDKEIRISDVWNGYFQRGHATEINAQWLPSDSGPVTLTIETGGTTVVRQSYAELNRDTRLAVPIYPVPGEAVTAVLQLADGRRIERQLDLKLALKPLRVRVDVAGAPTTKDTEIPIAAQKLPITPQGYDAVGQLQIDTRVLSQLRQSQLSSLEDYLSRCGTILLSGPGSTQLLARLRDIAGCGGRTIHLASSQPTHNTEQALPQPRRLESLLSGTHHQLPQIIALFSAVSMTLLLIAARSGLGGLSILGIALAAGLGMPLLMATLPTTTALATWAEMNAGDNNSRFIALMRSQGKGGDSDSPLILPRKLGVPDKPNDASYRIVLDDERPDSAALWTDNTFMRQTTLGFRGAIPAEPPLRIDDASGSTPVVSYHGDAASLPSWLLWQYEIYEIPSLAPGERWTPEPGLVGKGPSGPLRSLLLARGRGNALLTPAKLFDDESLGGDMQSWLLIHYRDGWS